MPTVNGLHLPRVARTRAVGPSPASKLFQVAALADDRLHLVPYQFRFVTVLSTFPISRCEL